MPIRTCVGCRQRREQAALIRIGFGADGSPYVRDRGPGVGRSAYVCPTASCVAEAVKPGRLERTIRRSVSKSVLMELAKVLECKLR